MNAIHYDRIQRLIFGVGPFFQAVKQHLYNSQTVKNEM